MMNRELHACAVVGTPPYSGVYVQHNLLNSRTHFKDR